MRADLVGQRFGRLIVLFRAENRYSKAYWHCHCECGNTTSVSTGGLRSGHTLSCGCLYDDSRGTAQRRHGLSKTPEYRIWKGMIARCENAGREYYPRYGGRGIKVCGAWRESFECFLRDMGRRPTPKHTLERIHNDSDYCPTNCRWATMQEQGQNTSRTRRITINGETLGVNAWARRLRMSKKTVLAKFG